MPAVLSEKTVSPSNPAAGAMLRSGGGSIISGLLALAATKVIAVSLGASSVALYETLQQIRQIAVAAATANGQTALVQGASSLVGMARREYLRSALSVFAIATVAVSLGMLILRERIAQAAGLPAGSGRMVAVLTLAVAVDSLGVFLSALLNAAGEIGWLAILQVLGGATIALGAWPAVLATRSGLALAFPTLLAIASLIQALAAWRKIRARPWFSECFQGAGRWLTSRAVKHFFSVSGVMLATGLMSTFSLLAVRTRIIHSAGLDTAGQFDAAWGVSMSQASLVLAALQTYYLPRLARAGSIEQRARDIGAVLPIAILVSAPVIAGLLVMRPMAVGLLFSSAFQAASKILRWTLIGDYFKITAWVLAMPMLATADMRVLLATDALVQAVFLGASWWLSRVREPAEGAAIGFVLSYAVCLLISWWYAARRHGFAVTRKRAGLWVAGLMLVLLAAASTWTDANVSGPKAAAWLTLTLAGAAGAWKLRP
jgi:PST family polysaccharide transporter